MKIGIDLLWVKHKVTGGMESYVRNLLDGFSKYADKNIEFILYLAKDNYESFNKYFLNENFQYKVANVESMSVGKRIIWENLFLNKWCMEDKIDILFTPVYSKPLINKKEIKYVTTIHDLQAIHFPEYFSKKKNLWLRYSWKRCAETSDIIIAISQFVKNDIIEKLGIEESKIKVIYNPIVKSNKTIDFDDLASKYNIEKENFFYTVSSMLPHKNLKTILHVMKEIKQRNLSMPNKLIISGVGGQSSQQVRQLIKELDLEDNIILTGFISDEERDCLYKNAKVFLFPSIFEGFGMPPIEALKYGTPVVLCNKTCLKEVTNDEAIYVEDSFSISEWVIKIQEALKTTRDVKEFKEYELERVTNYYLDVFKSINK